MAEGKTTFWENATVANKLATTPGGTADFSTNAVSVEGMIANNDAITQTKTVGNSTTTNFGRIQNAAGTMDKYYGAEITPSTGRRGVTAVEIYENQRNQRNQSCWVSGFPDTGVNRCDGITPDSRQTANILNPHNDGLSNCKRTNKLLNPMR